MTKHEDAMHSFKYTLTLTESLNSVNIAVMLSNSASSDTFRPLTENLNTRGTLKHEHEHPLDNVR